MARLSGAARPLSPTVRPRGRRLIHPDLLILLVCIVVLAAAGLCTRALITHRARQHRRDDRNDRSWRWQDKFGKRD